jgi:hypothetical protein
MSGFNVIVEMQISLRYNLVNDRQDSISAFIILSIAIIGLVLE